MFFFLSHNPILTFFNVHTKYQSIFTHEGTLNPGANEIAAF